jgi:hypothetical protein
LALSIVSHADRERHWLNTLQAEEFNTALVLVGDGHVDGFEAIVRQVDWTVDVLERNLGDEVSIENEGFRFP